MSIKGFLLVVLLLSSLPAASFARKLGKARVDSLLEELARSKEDTIKAHVLNSLCFSLHNNDPDKAIEYGMRSLKLSEQLHWKSGIGSAYASLSACYESSSDYKTALDYAWKAIHIFEQTGEKRNLAICYELLSNCYTDQGNLVPALQYELESLKIAEQLNNKNMTGGSMLNIGVVYLSLKEYALAEEYFLKALKIEEQLDDQVRIAQCLLDIGALHHVVKKNSSALVYLKRALVQNEKIDNKTGQQMAIADLGSVYRDMGDYPLSLEYAYRSLALSDSIGDMQGQASALEEIGITHLRLAGDSIKQLPAHSLIPATKAANLAKAIDYLERSAKMGRDIDSKEMLADVYLNLSAAYKQAGKHKEALENYVVYKAITDSMFSNDNKIKIADLETQRETVLKEKQIAINLVLEKQKRNERIFFVLGIGLLVALVIMVLRNYNRQKLNNTQLAQANKDLGTANSSLETSNRELAEEKVKSDKLTADLQELLLHKDELTAELELAASAKSAFLANMSHELRTPVTLFTGMLEQMKAKAANDEPADKQRIDIAYSNSRKLQRMVEELLDLSRLENQAQITSHGAQLIKKTVVAAAPLLRRMVYAFETYIEKEQLKLAYDDSKAQDAYIAVNEEVFEKIINNLVYNAVKFNRAGGSISVTLSTDAATQMAVITVSDTGKGIAADDLPHIFERFYQSSKNEGKAAMQGMGIGLSLVREFTQLHHGTVSVASKVGEGSSFTLLFPLAEKDTSPLEVEETEQLPIEEWAQFARQQTVLLVEDNEDMRYYIRGILGDRVALADSANGREALAWLEHNTPDLIISDIMMPEMDGREFVAHIKSAEQYRKIPLITVSAVADKESELGMLRMGIDDYMVKPFNAHELRVRVYNLLRNNAERMAYRAQQDEPGAAPATSKEADEFRAQVQAYVLSRLRDTNMSVNDMAHELALSERQLYRMSRQLTGYSPAQLVKEIRLQKAYELMLSGDINKIEDVARRVGYEHPGYFAKQFFERFGKRATDLL